MMFLPKTFIFAAFYLLLSLMLFGCSGLSVEQVPLKNPPSVEQDARPLPIGFNKIVFSIPTGTPLVSSSPKGTFGLFFCDGPYTLLAQTSMRGRGATNDTMRDIFNTTMEGMGYDVTGSPGQLFDEEADSQRTMLAVGGRITDVKMDVCNRTNWWDVPKGEDGEASIEVEWSVFDLINRRYVYKKTTKGYGEVKLANHDGIELLFEEALGAAIHNLGADDEFNDLVFYGAVPKNLPKTYPDRYEEHIFDPDEKVALSGTRTSAAPATGRWDELKRGVVVVQKSGHGSGFFITKEGHILTNAHVVGNADQMRIVTNGKKYKLVAEVLRLDRARDVALLKLIDIPDGMVIEPLPIRLDKPKVGDDVFVIGSPSLTRLQDTLTKGIISAHRKTPYTHMPILQSDVTTHPGSSGGPMLDASGNVIAITVSGYAGEAGQTAGLNNFIPIGDALEKLAITVE